MQIWFHSDTDKSSEIVKGSYENEREKKNLQILEPVEEQEEQEEKEQGGSFDAKCVYQKVYYEPFDKVGHKAAIGWKQQQQTGCKCNQYKQ